jgi:ABC-type Fe3+/spermidine/putrescine transport system ATPase subunit
MNAGHIDQLDEPSEIYDRPSTPFVADFIGDMNHLEGELERDGDSATVVVGGARFGIGRVVRDAQPGRPARVGIRPEEVHANTRGEGVLAICQTAMVLGHHVQVVALLESGHEIVALQRRSGDDQLEHVGPGDKVWLGWGPAAALLLGPADGSPTGRSADPVEVQA